MNRQQRRAQKHNKPKARKFYRLPQPILMQQAFEPIDKILDVLETGEWLRHDGEALISHNIYDYYPLIPALDGWLEYWDTAQQKFNFQSDFSPITELKKWIETDAAGTPDAVITAARAVVDQMKKIYLKTPIDEIRAHAQTVTIRFLLDEETEVIA